MRKNVFVIISVFVLMTLGRSALADENIKVVLNGEELSFDVSPEIVNGRTMVPMRKIFEALGAEVNWDEETKTASGVKKIIEVKFVLNEKEYSVCGIPFEGEAAAYVNNGRMMIPVRAVAESLGTDVEWEQDTKTVVINENVMDYEDCETYAVYSQSVDFQSNGFGVKVYANGEHAYVGEFKNGKYDGKGAASYSNGYYIGEFAENERSGNGKYVWNSGGYYSGEWLNNIRSGNGTCYMSNGDYYKATFVDDEIDGDIEYHYKNGNYLKTSKDNLNGSLKGNNSVYYEKNGSFRKSEGDDWSMESTVFYNSDGSLKNGIDTFRIEEAKATYTGNFADGKINGNGELVCDDETVYKGEFVNGAMEGQARVYWNIGICYEGYVKGGQFTQDGSFVDENGDFYKIADAEKAIALDNLVFYNSDNTLKDGKSRVVMHFSDIYDGEFADGKANGTGELYKNDKLFYSGDFVDGVMSGYGEIYYDDGTRYEGEVKDNKRDGNGIWHFENEKAYYSGEWRNGKVYGEGTLYYADGNQVKRVYDENGKEVRAEGLTNYSNGDVFIGTIIDGKIQGKGEYRYSDGSIYIGDFVDGKREGKGKYYFVSKLYVVSEWEDDKYLLNKNTYYYGSNGELINLDNFELSYYGTTYSGKMVKGQFSGKCTVTEDGVGQKVVMKNNVIQEVLPEYKELEYSNGDYFKGDVKNGKWHNGTGKWTGDDGDYFRGKWVNGKWYNGAGRITYSNGDYFEGTWYDGKREDGKIKMSYTNGEYFEGTLKDGYWYTGYGYDILSNGDAYKGDFYQGYKHGKCTYYDSDTGNYWVGSCEWGKYTSGRWYDKYGNRLSTKDSDNEDVNDDVVDEDTETDDAAEEELENQEEDNAQEKTDSNAESDES